MPESAKHSWDNPAEKPSYLKEMLTSNANISTGLGAAALGAGLSIPFGFGIALIPLVCYTAGAAIASLFVPNSVSFRNAVDLKHRRKRRERVRRHLLSELDTRLRDGAPEWTVYHRMLDRINSLRTIASNRQSSITEADVERLEDSGVDFLGLLLAKILLHERRKAIDVKSLSIRRETIQAQLRHSKSTEEQGALHKALADVETVLERYRRLENRQLGIDAAMLSMPDTVEEIYHHMITNPNSSSAAGYLQQAVERLRLEQELDYTMDSEIADIPALRDVASIKTASGG